MTDSGWVFTDDPEDPCGYCVVWQESDDPDKAAIGEDARPIWPDGSTAPRIYRGVHRECFAAVDAYVQGTLEGVTCDVDINGSPCERWVGHLGEHAAGKELVHR